ncbi:hypothetical protein [Actinokineospora inagensis]|uniref:hypothetical protein n=1 Tax=Actinokineospora inagensis TaxID=103730 RepID=UPI00047CEF8D|nr:hypothetical protein [Actinokineospora inagensis]
MACRKSSVFGALAAACALLLTGGTASASVAVPPPTPADFAAAMTAAKSDSALSYAKTNFRQAHGTDPATVTVADRGVPVYVLNPAFVAGTQGAPAGVLQYIAVTATANTGETATLRAAPESPGTWAVGSVFSGNDEETLSARLRPDAVLLSEPQINGWYELSSTGVTLLQASLPQSPVNQFLSLAEYQKQVKSRYGDKMPGSTYEKEHGIGFARGDAPPPAAPGLSTVAIVFIVIGGVVVLAVAGVLVLRRRRRPETP